MTKVLRRTLGLAGSVPTFSEVLSYGNSSLRLRPHAALAQEGLKTAEKGGGWNHVVSTVSPGIPGDSGSGFLDAQGRAFGVLSTLNILPEPFSSGRLPLSPLRRSAPSS